MLLHKSAASHREWARRIGSKMPARDQTALDEQNSDERIGARCGSIGQRAAVLFLLLLLLRGMLLRLLHSLRQRFGVGVGRNAAHRSSRLVAAIVTPRAVLAVLVCHSDPLVVGRLDVVD